MNRSRFLLPRQLLKPLLRRNWHRLRRLALLPSLPPSLARLTTKHPSRSCVPPPPARQRPRPRQRDPPPPAAPPAATVTPKPNMPLQRPTYKVGEKGETLRDIAQRTLGSVERWPEIYQLNRDLGKEIVVRAG